MAVAVAPVESVTFKVNDPVADGVPETTPVEAFKLKPAGSAPVATANVKGAAPPETVGAAAPVLKGTPTSPVVTLEERQLKEGGV